ncbi:MAG TPA: hypothetical protein VGQ41_24150 [Pyrinomonadaceae bacterium]|jgi:hypothetical protein|nr:hypothetical protein [Pyrinomonadaceae bacterium]
MKDKQNGHKTETPDVSHIRNVEVTHETSDIDVKAVLTFVVVLTIATAAVSVGMWLLFKYFNAQEAKEPQHGPMALTKKEDLLPPEPRLQSAPGFEITLEDGQKKNLEKAIPQAEYRALREQWDENLKTGLKDASGNVVGMPIQQAIDKVVSGEGLPSRVKGPGGKLSDYAISMPTASSSGREVEKRLQ